MGIQRDGGRRRQQRCSNKSSYNNINSDSQLRSGRRRRSSNRNSNFFLRFFRHVSTKQLHTSRTWSSFPIYAKLFWTRDDKSNGNTARHRNKKCHRHNKYIYPVSTLVLSLISPTVSLAQGVGGVSATANPIANSSGSVTNQAIQVLQGPYITNTYGGGVQCQGSTFNLTPYVQFADSRKHPWEDYYDEPQYNVTDATGKMVPTYVNVKNYPWEEWYDDRTYISDGSDGNTAGDTIRWFPDGSDITIIQDIDSANGVPDVVDSGGKMTPSWFKPVRTDMRANQSLNLGLSATLSLPLNRKLQKQCIQAADQQIALSTQTVANKRLDFEIARLKNCGELMKAGIMFHPKSPYYSICADVVVRAPGGKVEPHEHQIPQPNWTKPTSSQPSSESVLPGSDLVEPPSSLEQTELSPSSPLSYLPWLKPSSQEVLSPSKEGLLGVWQVGQMKSQPQQ